MKILEKITLIIYANIMLVVAILGCLLIFGWIDFDLIYTIIKDIIEGETSSKILFAINIIIILLSIKCIFFDSTSKEQIKERQGILLENESGKLMISKETIENLVNSVALNFQSAQDVSTKIELDKENNVKIFVNLVVSSDAVIKDLSINLQNKIKEKIKNSADLEVAEVNITVKKVVTNKDVE